MPFTVAKISFDAKKLSDHLSQPLVGMQICWITFSSDLLHTGVKALDL